MKGSPLKTLQLLMIALGLAVVGACAKVKQPTAPSAQEIAERLTLRDESPLRTQRWLQLRGFQQIERTGFGGTWPRTGPCFQTVKGILYRDHTVTRVCFAGGKDPVVMIRERSGYYWTEVYPNDLSYNLHAPSGLGAISDETVETLEQ